MRFVFEDSRGDLWIANQGVYRCNRFTGEVLSEYWTNMKTLNWTFKNKIEEDGKGYVWIASEFGGFYRYDPFKQKMSRMLSFATKTEDFIRIIREVDKKSLRSDGKRFISENVTALAKDQRGNIWTAAWVNLLPDSSSDKGEKSFFVVSKMDISAQKIHRYRLNNLLGANLTKTKQTIYTIYVESSDILWLGTSFGLVRFEPKSNVIKVYQADSHRSESLSSNQVHSIKPDKLNPNRFLWIGTNGGGLCRFDKTNQTFTHYSNKNGLPGNTVSSILIDNRGNLWLGTNKGLCNAVINPDSNNILSFRNYDNSDGISDDDFSFFYGQNAHQNAKGEMFFAGAKGISIFNPDEIKDNPITPPVVLSGFYLNFQPVYFGEPGYPFTAPVSRLKQIDLSFENNSFAIELAALDFHAPEKNRYAYKLEGYQDKWVYPVSGRRAVFTQVPPGKYIFHAKAANSDGVWNEKELTLIIHIIPPWYLTWWAYAPDK